MDRQRRLKIGGALNPGDDHVGFGDNFGLAACRRLFEKRIVKDADAQDAGPLGQAELRLQAGGAA